jgi:tetratricopeptide (TPR) repeat protein
MIVHSETEPVAATVESVRAVADEIVLLNCFPSDDRGPRAKRPGVKTVDSPWCDDLSALRNRCLANVSGDWVLWIEPGERLEADSAAALRQFVHYEAHSRAAYLLMIETPAVDAAPCGKQAAQIRLTPNWSSLRFSGRASESLREQIVAAGITTQLAPGRLIRDAGYDDADQKAFRAQSRIKLVTLEAEENHGYSPRLLLALGDAQRDLGNFDEAQHAYLQAVAASPCGSTDMLSAYYGLLDGLKDGQSMLQLSTCLDALETFPADAQLLMTMGDCLQVYQRMDLATRSFEAAFRLGKINLETWHDTQWHALAAVGYSRALASQGHGEQARRALEEALTQHPASTLLVRRLTELLANRPFKAAA